ncbi:MAG: caspase family protein [Deltaproteobacteria bacterium]|nr:caspase family protein [Deltaproteobacteria bacterium]
MDCAAVGAGVVVRGTMAAGWRYVVAGIGLAASALAIWTLWSTTALDRAYPLGQPTAITSAAQSGSGPILWVMSVGVSRYASPELNLEFADADATAMTEALREAAKRGPYREVRSLVLTNEDVTRQSIMEGLSRFLGQAGPDDVAMLFVAGHGVRDLSSGSYYFLPHPATADTLLSDGLRMSDFDELLRIVRRNVGSVIVMLDTCHSGALGIPTKRMVSADEMAAQVTTGEGFFLLAATKPGEESKEQTGLGHGAFTFAALEGLRGSADADGDGTLTVSELFSYVARRVPALTQGRQHPYSKMEGTDFAFLQVGDAGSVATPLVVAPAAPTAAGPPVGNVIGVLDFQNLRHEPAYDWISQALRLAFNTELSKVQALKVYSPELIDRTARTRGTDPLITARELGIGRLLTGAYYVSDKTLRIDARIVDARTGVNEASDSVEGQLDQFFDLQKQLVLSMLRRLRVQVSPEEGQSIETETNTDVDAYRLLLEAEGVVEPSPRAERTRKKTERHSSLAPLWRFLAGLAVGEARAEEVTPEIEQQVRALLERYRKALESKNLDEVAAVYVNFSERQRKALQTYLTNAKDLVVEIADIQVTPHHDGVVASFVRRDHFTDAQSGRPVRLEVRLTKVLVREQSTWKIGSGQ